MTEFRPHSPVPMRRRLSVLDRAAIALSGLCALHCIATLLFLGALSSVGYAFQSPLVHEVGLAIATLLAALAFYGGVRRHREWLPVAVGGAGLAAMLMALMIDHGRDEAILTVAGVALVALGHWLNHRAACHFDPIQLRPADDAASRPRSSHR